MASASITVTDQITKANADTINGYTTGTVTLNSVSDTAANLVTLAAIDNSEVTIASASITITDIPNVTQLKEINNATSGQLTLNTYSVTKERLDRDGVTGMFDQLQDKACLLYTSPSPRDRTRSRMPSSA